MSVFGYQTMFLSAGSEVCLVVDERGFTQRRRYSRQSVVAMILIVVLVQRRAVFQTLSKESACRIDTAENWGVTVLMLLAKIQGTEALYSTGTTAVATEI